MISGDHIFDVTTAPKRDSRHWTAGQVTWDEILEWMQHPANTKACGNYVLGRFSKTTVTHPGQDQPCSNLHRTKLAIELRGALTLDVDHAQPDFLAAIGELTCAYVLHTTYSSTAEEPRYRLIVPLSRTVAPDEYHAAAGALMQQLGVENFDPGSVQPERYMFLPSESRKGTFWYEAHTGPLADVEALLSAFQPDLSVLPLPKPSRSKRNPFEIDGPIGAFNRVYEDLDDLIREYDLPYETSGDSRYHLVGATAAAGMGEVTPGLYFSHHANDPAFGQTCSAFDMVRLHWFGTLDEDSKPGTPINKLPSTLAMLDQATRDKRVVRELLPDLGDDFGVIEPGDADDADGDDDWRIRFRVSSRTGKPTDDIQNWDLIAQNDPAFTGLYFNELSMAIESQTPPRWRAAGDDRPTFDSGDRSSLAQYIERTYGLVPTATRLDNIINEIARNRRVNPVRDYLDSLQWDGVSRIETALPGVKPTVFTKMVARKALVAAVARMYEPGIKWDHMLMLYGPEGLGKSHWVHMMSRGWSAGLGRIGDKDTLVTMQRSWILTADEGHSMRKADFDAQKEFITRTADVFRMPYDREAQVHQRHCVIWGTTNDDVFLRRQEGNRRFLIVKCEEKVDFDALTPEYVDQVWAEAIVLYRAGERLWLNEEESTLAASERDEFTEEDERVGTIEHYLSRLVPANWDSMSDVERQTWIFNRDQGMEAEGTERIDQVCSMQIWVEALGNRKGDHRVADLRAIAEILKQLPGWVRLPGRPKNGPYGSQLTFRRKSTIDGFDLI